MDFYFSLLKKKQNKTLYTLNCWALPPNVIIQYQYLQKHTVYATELHWCRFVIEMVSLFYLFFLIRQVFLFFFFIYCDSYFFCFWHRINIHRLVCWWQLMDKLAFMSCVYVLQCWETNECVWLLMMQINKTSGTYRLYIPSVKAITLHTLPEIRRWGQMMPFSTAVVYNAKESSCLQIDDPYLHAIYTPRFLFVKLYAASHWNPQHNTTLSLIWILISMAFWCAITSIQTWRSGLKKCVL